MYLLPFALHLQINTFATFDFGMIVKSSCVGQINPKHYRCSLFQKLSS